jgi:cytochrome c-type biogenesis protein CcmH/NrfF
LPVFGAGDVSAEPWAYDLSAELMSPFCPGRTLASCPSPQAAELVQWMVLQEAAGSTQEEVIAVLVDQWGEEILGAPPARGITLWAYIFPILGFVVGGGLAYLVLRRIVSGGPPSAGGAGVGSAHASAHASGGTTAESNAAGSISRLVRDPDRGSDDEDLARIVDRELEARV